MNEYYWKLQSKFRVILLALVIFDIFRSFRLLFVESFKSLSSKYPFFVIWSRFEPWFHCFFIRFPWFFDTCFLFRPDLWHYIFTFPLKNSIFCCCYILFGREVVEQCCFSYYLATFLHTGCISYLLIDSCCFILMAISMCFSFGLWSFLFAWRQSFEPKDDL